MFILLVWLGPIKKYEPIVSRGSIPYIGLTNNLIQILVAIPQYASFVFRVRSFCYFKYFVEIPFHLISLLIIPLHFFRYLYINNIKESVYAESKANRPKDYIQRKFKLFKIFTSPIAYGIYIGTIVGLWIVGSLIFLGVNHFSFGEYIVFYYVHIFSVVIYFLVAGLMLSVILYDRANWKRMMQTNCNLWRIFVENDSFYFRVELIIYLVAISLLVLDLIFRVTLPSVVYLELTTWLIHATIWTSWIPIISITVSVY